MRPFVYSLSLGVWLAFSAPVAAAAPAAKKVSPDIDQLLANAIRDIHFDICLPATAEEYQALGKNAVIMVESKSAIATELPLRSVYLIHQGVRIALQRIALLEKSVDGASGRAQQTSFYLLPIHYMKTDARLLADFTGERTGFGMTSFSPKSGLDPGAPAFARLDEYDAPGDADPTALAALLTREYPGQFPSGQ